MTSSTTNIVKPNPNIANHNYFLISCFLCFYSNKSFSSSLLQGVKTNAVSHEQRISNCEKVIDALSHDVLNVDLSHITAENIVDGDISTIQNLLEIFKELLDFILDVDDEFDFEDAAMFDGKKSMWKFLILCSSYPYFFVVY